MAKENDWFGAEKFSAGVLAGCLYEKLTNNLVSLLSSAKLMLKELETLNPKTAALHKKTIDKAEKELLSYEI